MSSQHPLASQNAVRAAPRSKWGEAMDAGFQVIPDVLFKNQAELKLNPTELIVLLHLTMAWWFAERHPFPRATTIARRMGIAPRTVQRCLKKLKSEKLILPIRRAANSAEGRTAYELTPLVRRLVEFAANDPRFRSSRNADPMAEYAPVTEVRM